MNMSNVEFCQITKENMATNKVIRVGAKEYMDARTQAYDEFKLQ